MSRMKGMLEVASSLRALADSLEGLAEEQVREPDAPQTTPPKPEEPAMTIAELREAVAALTNSDTRKQIKAIVQRYGAEKLTELDPKHYAAVLAEVRAL